MKNVKVYSTESCVYCKMAKELLDKNNVKYEVRDVSKDEKARAELVEKSGQTGVPVLDIDGEIIIGFDKRRIKELLEIK